MALDTLASLHTTPSKAKEPLNEGMDVEAKKEAIESGLEEAKERKSEPKSPKKLADKGTTKPAIEESERESQKPKEPPKETKETLKEAKEALKEKKETSKETKDSKETSKKAKEISKEAVRSSNKPAESQRIRSQFAGLSRRGGLAFLSQFSKPVGASTADSSNEESDSEQTDKQRTTQPTPKPQPQPKPTAHSTPTAPAPARWQTAVENRFQALGRANGSPGSCKRPFECPNQIGEHCRGDKTGESPIQRDTSQSDTDRTHRAVLQSALHPTTRRKGSRERRPADQTQATLQSHAADSFHSRSVHFP